MKIAEKKTWATEVVQRLHAEYPDAECALIHKNAFELVVSTVLSAQCTDAMVNKVTPKLFERYPTPDKLARSTQAAVEKLVHSTGFYRNKAKNIRGLAKTLVADFDGVVPSTMEELLTLPGVARKTANVVQNVIFRIADGVCVDTHVKRIAKHLGLTRHTDAVKVERDLMKIVGRDDWIDISMLLIFHGRQVCIARRPRCTACVLADHCVGAIKPL
jgi:endonuclease-3